MSATETRSVGELRETYSSFVDFSDGTVAGYAHLGRPLNLNAIAIAFGLDGARYEPEKYHPVAYSPDGAALHLLVFDNGVVLTLDGESPDGVIDEIRTALETLEGLGLVSDVDLTVDVVADDDVVPVPPTS